MGRRLFILFLLCAGAPLLVFSWLGYREAKDQLTDQAFRSLRSDCKSTGLVVLDRIMALDTDIDAFVQAAGSALASARLEGLTPHLRARLEKRVSALGLVDATGCVRHTMKGSLTCEPLTAEELAHLRTGRSALLTQADAAGRVHMVLLRSVETSLRADLFLAAELQKDALFAGDQMDFAETHVAVVDRDTGRLVHGDLLEHEMGAEFLRAMRGHATEDVARPQPGYISASWDLFAARDYRIDWRIARFQEVSTFLAPLSNFRHTVVFIALVTLALVSFLSVSQIRRLMRPIEQLTEASRAVAHMDFEHRVELNTRDEFAQLGATFNEMARSVQGHLVAAESLNELGISLVAERDSKALLSTFVAHARRIADANYAAVFLLAEEVFLDAAEVDSSVAPKERVSLRLPLQDERGRPILGCSVGRAFHRGRQETAFTGSSPRGVSGADGLLAGVLGSHGHSLALPLRNDRQEVIGVLQLGRAADGESSEGFSETATHLAQSMAAQAAVTLLKNDLLGQYKSLFEAIVEMIVAAIDEKSPYTGGHCRRVPIITMMLAEAVNETVDGPLGPVRFTEDELYELHIAALLHDCGKIVIPVHVVDKATKLQTLFDRIELVDTRLEIVRREAEIRALHDAALGGGPLPAPDVCGTPVDRGWLAETREFLHRCNLGTEFMKPEDRDRVRELGSGHSWVDMDGARRPLLTEDEIENLSIAKGTLTAAERNIINHHVVASIKMLETLPYPKQLAQVPLLAGCHHERMDGKGYPRGLKGDEIPLRGRVLSICDIFEALTAKDRPYKKAMPLSVALRILGTMKLDGHVDPDLFDIFIERKVYLQYAREHLNEEQIDDLDEALIPGFRSAAPTPV